MYGKYQHTVDNKGRIFVPSKLREDLGETFFVMPGIENCLNVYTQAGWQVMQDKINEPPLAKRAGLRVLMGNICECTPDKQGRFLIPTELRDYAGLKQEVTFLGQGDHAEIWDAETYRKTEEEKLSPEYMRSILEALEI